MTFIIIQFSAIIAVIYYLSLGRGVDHIIVDDPEKGETANT